jgi:hypothetical protein
LPESIAPFAPSPALAPDAIQTLPVPAAAIKAAFDHVKQHGLPPEIVNLRKKQRMVQLSSEADAITSGRMRLTQKDVDRVEAINRDISAAWARFALSFRDDGLDTKQNSPEALDKD